MFNVKISWRLIAGSSLIILTSCAKVDDSLGDFKAQFVKPDQNIIYDNRGLPAPSDKYTDTQEQKAKEAFSKKLDPSAAYVEPKPLEVQPQKNPEKPQENKKK